MKKSVIILCLIIVAVIGIVVIHKIQVVDPSSISSVKNLIPLKRVVHSSHLFDKSFFMQAYEKAGLYKKALNEKVLGGIIPHHLLAAPLLAGFFEGIAHQKVTTVILLSPNHFGVGPYNIATSKGVWTTIFGDLETDTLKVSQLENVEHATNVSEGLFDTEHGIYGITPFIKKTFPNAKMIPIVIKGGTSKEECDKLVLALNSIVDDQTLILVSSDFSHYLPSDQADFHDRESIPAIESFNTDKVFTIDHVKNIDSPESVYVLLKLMQLKKATKPILIENTNSAKLTNQPNLQSTTSYLTMYFTKKDSLSVDSIFGYIDPTVASIKNTNPDEYTVIATGDVMPARSVNSKLVQLNDLDYPYKKTVGFLKSADIVFINLETPLIPDCQPVLDGMRFCGDQRNVQGLVYAGVTVANIANNHAGNYGIDGVHDTVDLLKKNKINVTGNDNQQAIIAVRNKKFGFLGYNSIGNKEPGIAWADISQVQKDIENLKKQVNFVIVTFHWGVEYTGTPNAVQVQLAHAAIDAGADLVIGNHPHWIEGIERYKGKYIMYAHGNYVFDQMWSQETREGVLGKYTFNNDGLIGMQFVPIIIDDYAQPGFATETEATNILTRMKDLSK